MSTNPDFDAVLIKISELERLRAENEQLKAENKWLYDQIAAQMRTAGAAAMAALEPKP